MSHEIPEPATLPHCGTEECPALNELAQRIATIRNMLESRYIQSDTTVPVLFGPSASDLAPVMPEDEARSLLQSLEQRYAHIRERCTPGGVIRSDSYVVLGKLALRIPLRSSELCPGDVRSSCV